MSLISLSPPFHSRSYHPLQAPIISCLDSYKSLLTGLPLPGSLLLLAVLSVTARESPKGQLCLCHLLAQKSPREEKSNSALFTTFHNLIILISRHLPIINPCSELLEHASDFPPWCLCLSHLLCGGNRLSPDRVCQTCTVGGTTDVVLWLRLGALQGNAPDRTSLRWQFPQMQNPVCLQGKLNKEVHKLHL